MLVPLAVVTAAAALAGCLQQPDSRTNGYAPVVPVATATPTAPPAATLSQEDPRLGMQVLAGKPLVDVLTSSVQVLPDGNVPIDASAPAVPISPTTRTQWVRSSAATTLWSGPDSDASAFTDVPAGAFFRVNGPAKDDRTPVYYVGDGLFRMPGDGWVESSEVSTVEAPAPGQVPAIDADARTPLPVWVQAHRATPLMSGPDDKAVTLTDLPQWTFLKVAGVERNGRLLVNYAGDYATRKPGIGWVDESSVGPAGDPGQWVSNFRATPLWSGVDAKAVKFTDIPQWTKLRLVDGAAADPTRIEVQFFGDAARQPGTAWISLADIGPITPPVPLPTLPVSAATTATQQIQQQAFGSGDEFINAVGAAAHNSMRTSGVPASVTVAQAILESDWGRSRLTRQGNNLFGIKALGAPGPAGIVTLATWEHLASGDVIVQAPFRAYYTLEQSIDDHGKFFTSNKRYAAALAVAKDARAFARGIQEAGYATDPSYASKLIGLMDKYNLYRFDQ
jgi:mannosyl-glycoprotein endo-beta-N-acetylglucosaminidase